VAALMPPVAALMPPVAALMPPVAALMPPVAALLALGNHGRMGNHGGLPLRCHCRMSFTDSKP
jgi:hypothetical protein